MGPAVPSPMATESGYTRRGYDWARKYPWIVDALLSLRVRSISRPNARRDASPESAAAGNPRYSIRAGRRHRRRSDRHAHSMKPVEIRLPVLTAPDRFPTPVYRPGKGTKVRCCCGTTVVTRARYADNSTSTLRTYIDATLGCAVEVWLWRYSRVAAPGKLCQQFPSLGHRNQYRPMLGPSRHASELQALVHGFAILVGSIRTHETSGIPKAYAA
jgi:hypothetical protein